MRTCLQCGGPNLTRNGICNTCEQTRAINRQTEAINKQTEQLLEPPIPTPPRVYQSSNVFDQLGLFGILAQIVGYYFVFCWSWWLFKLPFVLIFDQGWPTWVWIGFNFL